MSTYALAPRRALLWTVLSLSSLYLLAGYNKKLITDRLNQKNVFSAALIPKILIGAAICLVIIGLGQSVYAWQINTSNNHRAAKLVTIANQKDRQAIPIVATTASTPSTVKPSGSTIASYSVAPNLPKYLIIPKLTVNARILSVGLNSEGALETPGNVYDTAWYNGSSLPGQPGAMLIDGHISSWTAHGVFYGLDTLVPGDTIEVERGDGTLFNYRVVKTQVYSANSVDMNAAITPVEPGSPGLNLISCTGEVMAGTSEFNQRIVVFASLI